MLILSNSFVDVNFVEEYTLMEVYWKGETLHMNVEEYKSVMLALLRLVQNHQPKRILLENTLFAYSIAPATQIWTQTIILQDFKDLGHIKVAITTAEDFFSQVSWEQLLEIYQPNENKINFSFFAQKTEAQKWLLANHKSIAA